MELSKNKSVTIHLENDEIEVFKNILDFLMISSDIMIEDNRYNLAEFIFNKIED